MRWIMNAGPVDHGTPAQGFSGLPHEQEHEQVEIQGEEGATTARTAEAAQTLLHTEEGVEKPTVQAKVHLDAPSTSEQESAGKTSSFLSKITGNIKKTLSGIKSGAVMFYQTTKAAVHGQYGPQAGTKMERTASKAGEFVGGLIHDAGKKLSQAGKEIKFSAGLGTDAKYKASLEKNLAGKKEELEGLKGKLDKLTEELRQAEQDDAKAVGLGQGDPEKTQEKVKNLKSQVEHLERNVANTADRVSKYEAAVANQPLSLQQKIARVATEKFESIKKEARAELESMKKLGAKEYLKTKGEVLKGRVTESRVGQFARDMKTDIQEGRFVDNQKAILEGIAEKTGLSDIGKEGTLTGRIKHELGAAAKAAQKVLKGTPRAFEALGRGIKEAMVGKKGEGEEGVQISKGLIGRASELGGSIKAALPSGEDIRGVASSVGKAVLKPFTALADLAARMSESKKPDQKKIELGEMMQKLSDPSIETDIKLDLCKKALSSDMAEQFQALDPAQQTLVRDTLNHGTKLVAQERFNQLSTILESEQKKLAEAAADGKSGSAENNKTSAFHILGICYELESIRGEIDQTPEIDAQYKAIAEFREKIAAEHGKIKPVHIHLAAKLLPPASPHMANPSTFRELLTGNGMLAPVFAGDTMFSAANDFFTDPNFPKEGKMEILESLKEWAAGNHSPSYLRSEGILEIVGNIAAEAKKSTDGDIAQLGEELGKAVAELDKARQEPINPVPVQIASDAIEFEAMKAKVLEGKAQAEDVETMATSFHALAAHHFAGIDNADLADPASLGPTGMPMAYLFQKTSHEVALSVFKNPNGEANNLEQAQRMVDFYTTVAEKALENGDIFTALAITSGLGGAGVARLRKEGKISKKTNARIAKLQARLDIQFSFKATRAEYAQARMRYEASDKSGLPPLPPINMLLTDLTFIKDGNPNYKENGSLHLDKVRMLKGKYDEFTEVQRNVSQTDIPPLRMKGLEDLTTGFEGETFVKAQDRVDKETYNRALELAPRSQTNIT